MRQLFITNVPVLEPLLDFDIENVNIDIHNEFDLVLCKKTSHSVEFYFKRSVANDNYPETNAAFIFSDLVETTLNDGFQSDNPENGVLVNFARGGLTDQNEYYTDESIKYFFLGFYGGDLIDILCKEAIIILW